MSRVGDVLEREFHEFAATLDADYTVHFGFRQNYVVVLFKGKIVEECYTGDGYWNWRRKRKALRRIVRGHRKFLATATAFGVVAQ